ncbi:hypothetical protein Vafri_2005 [Volvox africanus]|nr:hypothetical protein Vafri_2005 [Volvox africanus]
MDSSTLDPAQRDARDMEPRATAPSLSPIQRSTSQLGNTPPTPPTAAISPKTQQNSPDTMEGGSDANMPPNLPKMAKKSMMAAPAWTTRRLPTPVSPGHAAEWRAKRH